MANTQPGAPRRIEGAVNLPALTEAVVPPDLLRRHIEDARFETRGKLSFLGIGTSVEVSPAVNRVAAYDIGGTNDGVRLYAEGKPVGHEISGNFKEVRPLVERAQDLARVLRDSGVPQAANWGNALLRDLLSSFGEATSRGGPSIRTVRELNEGFGYSGAQIALDGCSALLTELEKTGNAAARALGDRLVAIMRQQEADPTARFGAFLALAHDMIGAIGAAKQQKELIDDAEWGEMPARTN